MNRVKVSELDQKSLPKDVSSHMEVRLDANAAKVIAASTPKPAERPSKPAEDKVVFTEATSLETALEKTPAVRSEVVERAKHMVGDPTYPPRETLRKIASLLAIHLTEE